jgi:hypothetical protein
MSICLLSPLRGRSCRDRSVDRIGYKKIYLIGIGLLAVCYLTYGLAQSWELVPSEQMGRWVGINRFFNMVLSAIMALSAGIIWDRIGPQYIFILFVAVDLLVRLPLLIGSPETLHHRLKTEPERGSDK